MSRYDGLIIPRSYNDYFSRSRPEDARALAATMTESTFNPAGSVPVNGQAVNNALANYEKINNVTLNASTDLNDIITEGHYTCYPLNQMANTPTTNSYGILIVHKSSVYILQEITTAERKYTRVKTQTGFTNWIEVATEFTLANQSNGLPLIETDLNNVKTVGRYVSNQDTQYTNTPLGANPRYFSLEVIRTTNLTNQGYMQILFNYNTNEIFSRIWVYRTGDGFVWSDWQKLTTESDLTNYPKFKEVTATSSANGNIDLGLNGYENIILSIQSYNSSGVNNDTIIIPYKLGDEKPQGASNGRWGAHCFTSNATMTVKANETIYCTVCYIEKSH